MKKYELDRKKEINNRFLEELIGARKKLEQTYTVQKYFGVLKNIEKNLECQKYLESLEIGIDGTVFSPYEEYVTNDFKATHFGLSKVLVYAFDLLGRNNKKNGQMEMVSIISFEALMDYVANAREILSDMQYYEGDRTVEGKYGLGIVDKIYENPRNYSIVELKEVLPLTNFEFRNNYNVNEVFVEGREFVALDPVRLSKSDYEKLTPREREAFYGEGAKKALRVEEVKVKVKTK